MLLEFSISISSTSRSRVKLIASTGQSQCFSVLLTSCLRSRIKVKEGELSQTVGFVRIFLFS